MSTQNKRKMTLVYHKKFIAFNNRKLDHLSFIEIFNQVKYCDVRTTSTKPEIHYCLYLYGSNIETFNNESGAINYQIRTKEWKKIEKSFFFSRLFKQ